MSKTAAENSYELTPSWKYYFIPYLLGVLTIPLVGIGLIVLYLVRKKQMGKRYVITDSQISSIDTKYHRNVDLVNIEEVRVQQNRLQQKLGVGTLILQTAAFRMELAGIENPEELQPILEKAIQAELQRREQAQQAQAHEPRYKPGSMDRMEYLTGLWQQGLISEEDFEKERRHFE